MPAQQLRLTAHGWLEDPVVRVGAAVLGAPDVRRQGPGVRRHAAGDRRIATAWADAPVEGARLMITGLVLLVAASVDDSATADSANGRV